MTLRMTLDLILNPDRNAQRRLAVAGGGTTHDVRYSVLAMRFLRTFIDGGAPDKMCFFANSAKSVSDNQQFIIGRTS